MHMHLANVCVFVFEFADVYNVYVKHVQYLYTYMYVYVYLYL